MEIIKYPSRQQFESLIKRPEINNADLKKVVLDILNEVKDKGDKALQCYSVLFDKIELTEFKVSKAEIDEAVKALDKPLKDAILLAKSNIEKFHNSQKISEKVVETTPGVKCWQKSIAIEKVGLYIPGGTAPLFSTVLMLGIPAKIAGCKEVVLCTPPGKDGKIQPSILYTAQLVGITQIYKIGGVQAIGAMAYGTETIPRVYKIFGPGNQYVTAAKQMVNRQGIAIDMPAGPSEVAVIADKTSNPEFIAADLLSQAEHGKDSQVVLATIDETIIDSVIAEVDAQLSVLPRAEIAKVALNNSRIIIFKNYDELMDFMNDYAPEHLIIAINDFESIAAKVVNAGSVFLGHLTSESAGDYASGTNHTLPTNGFARVYSGVNLDSFIKKVTFQQISEYGLFNIGPAIEKMAMLEDLHGHKNAVTIRLKSVLKK